MDSCTKLNNINKTNKTSTKNGRRLTTRTDDWLQRSYEKQPSRNESYKWDISNNSLVIFPVEVHVAMFLVVFSEKFKYYYYDGWILCRNVDVIAAVWVCDTAMINERLICRCIYVFQI